MAVKLVPVTYSKGPRHLVSPRAPKTPGPAMGEIAGGPRDVSITMRTVQGLALVTAYGVGGAVPLAAQ